MNTNQFQHAEDEYFRLKGQLAAGRITPEQFDAALKNLMVQDAQGRYWMLGPDTGKWYVHDGQTWVEAQPPVSAPGVPITPSPVEAQPAQAQPRGGGKLPVIAIGVVLLVVVAVVAVVLAINAGLLGSRAALNAPTAPAVVPTAIAVASPVPTVTPTLLTTPIFGEVVCSPDFDKTAQKPINPSPNKIVAVGTGKIYASCSYQVPEPSSFKVTWYHDGTLVLSSQQELTSTTGTMWVGTARNDNSILATGAWKFELRAMDDKWLLTDVCTIR